MCSVDAIPITSPFPAVWVSDVDATDEAAGIHCGRISDSYGRLAVGVAKHALRIAEAGLTP